MKVDEAVLKLLNLDPDRTSVVSHGGGGCSSASTLRITTKLSDGKEMNWFMKTGTGKDAEIMFEGEYASFRALHAACPTICPDAYGWGRFTSSPSTYFLVEDFLRLTSRSSSGSSGTSLATNLARLHTTPAPIPENYSKPMFGFPVTTCCGDTPQDNSWKEDWAEFFGENRLRFILARSEMANGSDAGLRELVEQTISQVVPRLLSASHLNNGEGVTPVVVHGDLWSGNASRGSIGDSTSVQDVVFDPSSCYAHSEYELGIMRMFGGFGKAFLREYHEICPKTEPSEEYEDRVQLYMLYHQLNHHALFGGGYRSGAVSVMKELLAKYGKGT
ncbi:Ketosamine-3-kinase [Patellaria atrata CBS 101060]|uniref:protein-ribulosamine 3-kinase n=1 Tax=Patellaria atrata CBS 101060 TaxID=1346257 RepID=A0A9P4VRT6_9PEZI|nr:Ketosamine-3-kinase [Patellaria atrata CBS 101060]